MPAKNLSMRLVRWSPIPSKTGALSAPFKITIISIGRLFPETKGPACDTSFDTVNRSTVVSSDELGGGFGRYEKIPRSIHRCSELSG